LDIGDAYLTPRKYDILITVSNTYGFSQPVLVERPGVARSPLADIVRRMLKKGLLQRRRTKDDARAYAVRLTEEGWRLLRAAEPMVKRVDDKILSMLASKQREQFLTDLQTIVEALTTPSAMAAVSRRR
jgi:DNA-binding MarR family transcriptional regulator